MVQHVHDVRAADAFRIVQPGLVVATLLEVGDALGGVVLHVLLAAELDCASRAGLRAGRGLVDRHPVGAQRALVGLAVLLRDAGDVEGAAAHAVAAADAVFLMEIDDAVGVLDDGAGCRAGLEAARVGAVHAAVLADQPLELALFLHLGVAHDCPRVLRQVDRIVVDADTLADLVAHVVPLHARHLARLAADAGGYVDKLGDLDRVPGLGRGRRGRGALLDV